MAKIEENREKSRKSAFGDKAKFSKKFSDIAEKRWESVSDMIWAMSKFSKFSVLGGQRGYRAPIGVPGGKNFLKIEVVQKCVETRFLEFEGENRKFSKIEQVSPSWSILKFPNFEYFGLNSIINRQELV